MKKLYKILFTFIQMTWGLPQNALGLLICLILLLAKHYPVEYDKERGVFITYWGDKMRNSMSLGIWLFLAKDSPNDYWSDIDMRILSHEFGHTIQSLFFGPFWILFFGIPSMTWNLIFFERSNKPYHYFYPERFANYLGKKFTGQDGVDW